MRGAPAANGGGLGDGRGHPCCTHCGLEACAAAAQIIATISHARKANSISNVSALPFGLLLRKSFLSREHQPRAHHEPQNGTVSIPNLPQAEWAHSKEVHPCKEGVATCKPISARAVDCWTVSDRREVSIRASKKLSRTMGLKNYGIAFCVCLIVAQSKMWNNDASKHGTSS